MKTNIKMRVTPEQSKRVQEICFENGIEWATSGKEFQGFYEWIYIDENYMYCFSSIINKEIDADLFIRTNGTCEEDKYTMIDTIIHKPYNVAILEKKLQKKNEILKKARIKRKNQREELHKLNLKLQKCISFEEHHQVVDELKKDINFRNETIKNTFQIGKDRLKEIEQLKAEIKSLKESSKISCNMLHSQKDKIDRLELNYVMEQSNYKKEVEKLKSIIEYLESKVK